MTCIACLTQNDRFYIAGDSRVSLNHSLVFDRSGSRKQDYPKIFKLNGFVFGVCGSVRVSNALKYTLKLNVSETKDHTSIYSFMVNTFTKNIRDCLKESGCLSVYRESHEMNDCELISMYNGEVYYMSGDFSIVKIDNPYFAIGAGYSYALGSLFSTIGIKNPSERVRLAVSSAANFENSVGGDIKVFSYKI